MEIYHDAESAPVTPTRRRRPSVETNDELRRKALTPKNRNGRKASSSSDKDVHPIKRDLSNRTALAGNLPASSIATDGSTRRGKRTREPKVAADRKKSDRKQSRGRVSFKEDEGKMEGLMSSLPTEKTRAKITKSKVAKASLTSTGDVATAWTCNSTNSSLAKSATRVPIPIDSPRTSDGVAQPAANSASSGLSNFIEKRRGETGKTVRSRKERENIAPASSDCSGLDRDFSLIEQSGDVCMDISRGFHTPAQEQSLLPSRTLPVLSLGNFQESLWLDFGDEGRNVVGQVRSLSFLIEAPSSQCRSNSLGYYSVEFERIPFKKGFDLVVETEKAPEVACGVSTNASGNHTDEGEEHVTSFRKIAFGVGNGEASEKSNPTILNVRNGERKKLTLSWTPTEAGGVSEAVHLKLPRGRIRITARGKARNVKFGKEKKKKKEKISQRGKETPAISNHNPQKTSSRSSRNRSRIEEKLACSVPSTPAPDFSTPTTVYARSTPAGAITSAAKEKATINIDSDWADKQCKAFAKWLNYTLQPTEDLVDEVSGKGGFDVSAFDRSGLRTLLIHRRRARGRKKAVELYQSNEMRAICGSIEKEVNSGKLAIRSDRDVFADVALRGQLIALLLSYSTPWLRLGLETVFGEILTDDITRDSGKSFRPKAILKRFILDRVLSDPFLSKKYTGGRRTKVLSGRFEKEYKMELRKHSLQRILLLVTFLDRAKIENVLETVPCLFSPKSKFKSSRDVIISICRDLLFREGNIFKHLSTMGLTVSYKQEPIDEFDYSVLNLAVDLRDGVRLARMTEIMTQDTSSSLIRKMRVPAVSRLQKLHNVNAALSALAAARVQNLDDIANHHVVDGHRPKVLKLLWCTIAHFQLPSIVDLDLLQQEIVNVRHANKSRQTLLRCVVNDDPSEQEATLEGPHSHIGGLLLEWCRVVCSCFGVPVRNFTTSFADGRVLCLLVHYYHPGMLKQSEILPTTRDLPNDVDLTEGRGEYDQALRNERRNSVLANKRILDLGGVPGMFPITNSVMVPEVKSTLLCVAYLCSRLMESSKEILATIAVQNFYRRYRERVLVQKKHAAAIFIFRFWKENKAAYFARRLSHYGPAVQVIEGFLIKNKAKIYILRTKRNVREKRFAAAICIQNSFHRWIAWRKNRLILVQARETKAMLAAERTRSQLSLEARAQRMAIVIQSSYRKYKSRDALLSARQAVVTIQKTWRGFVAAFQFHCNLLDIVTIQSCARRRSATRAALQRKLSVQKLQRTCFTWLARRRNARSQQSRNRQIEAVEKIQRAWGIYLGKKRFALMESSSTKISAAWRQYQQEVRYMKDLMDIIQIQCCARRIIANHEAQSRLASIIEIQKVVRMYRSKRFTSILRLKYSNAKEIARRHEGAIKLQMHWRRFQAESRYECILMDIIYSQACVRRFLAMKTSSKIMASILILQCAARRQLATRQFQALEAVKIENHNFLKAIVGCQTKVRRRLASKKVDSIRKRVQAITTIQAFYRSYIVKTEIYVMNMAAISIQTLWRTFAAELSYHCALVSAVTIQSSFRQYFARNKLLMIRKMNEEDNIRLLERQQASTVIQTAVRCTQAKEILKKHRAARQIQRTWRGYFQQVDFLVSILSTIVIQSFGRQVICRKQYITVKKSTLAVQGAVRGFTTRQRLRKEVEAVCDLQSWYRGVRAATSFRKQLNAVRIIQSCTRDTLRRRSLRLQNSAASDIQRIWRGYSTSVDYMVTVLAVIQIQSFARMLSARSKAVQIRSQKVEADFSRRQRYFAATLIQRSYRVSKQKKLRSQNVLKIQRFTRKFLFRNRRAKIMQVTMFIQSAFRGRVVRSMRSKKTRAVAHKIERANQKARAEPQMCLGVRTIAALGTLQSSKRLSEVIRAIKTLEISTRLSEKCCIIFAAANAPHELFALVRTCNRSLPHIELLHHILLTLYNVAKYPELLVSVATNESIEVLMDLTQMFRDKENIFCLAIGLLESVVFSDEDLLIKCRSTENIRRLEGIRALCKRRLAMTKSSVPSDRKRGHEMKRGLQRLEKILKRCLK